MLSFFLFLGNKTAFVAFIYKLFVYENTFILFCFVGCNNTCFGCMPTYTQYTYGC